MCDKLPVILLQFMEYWESYFVRYKCPLQSKKQSESYLHFGHAKGEAKNFVCMNLNRTVAFGCFQYFNSSRYF